MINLKHIFDGWANVIKNKFDALDPAIKLEAEIRLQHCDKCYMRTNNKCDPDKVGKHVETDALTKGCGCNISAKALSPCTKCPLGIWNKMSICNDQL